MEAVRTRRLLPADRGLARETFRVMAEVFGEPSERLSDEYVDALLRRDSFWAFAALADDHVVGGITAHTLPMTRSMTAELFIYDLAVRADFRRRGVASRLVRDLRAAAAVAGIAEVFVPADNDDEHALEFYRAQGGQESPVTFFTFRSREPGLAPGS